VRAGDPLSKGGSEATVKIAKADLVPTEHNLRPAYTSMGELQDACDQWMAVGGVVLASDLALLRGGRGVQSDYGDAGAQSLRTTPCKPEQPRAAKGSRPSALPRKRFVARLSEYAGRSSMGPAPGEK
jgi:hypothetical protein